MNPANIGRSIKPDPFAFILSLLIHLCSKINGAKHLRSNGQLDCLINSGSDLTPLLRLFILMAVGLQTLAVLMLRHFGTAFFLDCTHVVFLQGLSGCLHCCTDNTVAFVKR